MLEEENDLSGFESRQLDPQANYAKQITSESSSRKKGGQKSHHYQVTVTELGDLRSRTVSKVNMSSYGSASRLNN